MLYQDDVIFRPPMEADSVLLEVTSGCTYGKCSFCACSNGERKFRRIPMEVIRENAQTLGIIEWHKERLFLLGDNAFVLKTSILEEIFGIIHQYLPKARKISMFARTDDIGRKSDAELLSLKEQGLGDLYIGVESGSDRILTQFNKGVSKNDMLRECGRLDDLGISYSMSAIFGLGGRHGWREHALETAEFFNCVHPKTIRMMSLTPWEGTPLYREIAAGNFEEMEPGQVLLEQRLFLEKLKVQDCLYVGTHVSNTVSMLGMFPEHKEKLLAMLDHIIGAIDLTLLDKTQFKQW